MLTARWVVIVAVAAIFIMAATASADAEVQLKVGDSFGSGIVTIPVTISSAIGVTGLQFRLNFDPALLSASDQRVVDLGELTGSWSVQTNHGKGWSAAVMFNPSLKPLNKEKGIVAYVRLKVNDSAVNGKSCPLRLTDVIVADSNGNAMPHSVVNGTFVK